MTKLTATRLSETPGLNPRPSRKKPLLKKPLLKRIAKGGFVAALPFLAPALAAYVVFVIGPMFSAVRLSLYKWSGFTTDQQVFVGFQNYVRLFTKDPVFWTAVQNSIIWVLLSLVIPTSLGLMMALALNRPVFGRNVFRSVFYIPGVLAPIAIANMWRWMYNPNYGIFSDISKTLHLGDGSGVTFLSDPKVAIYAVFAAFVWQVAGLNMVLFLAGLQSVSKELVESAKLDGANAWQVFRNVTLPALRPTVVVVLVLTIVNSIKVFDLVVGMTGGGPAQKSQVLALWSYTQSFLNHDFGLGNATATVLLLITLVLVIPYMIWSTKGNED
ncbi:carbohydrate ABC transporter permease [Arthrobacter sp. B2a2-09]|uniref:carbohydrate ABC transporter permease n=1 Tax=Arthrobacter sp. B2a2-09 TaxID=2952822 RepID=UPI0022CD6532|nr:sugar ABC transporter permease [Arthrobacter sp. B2a2-09]MCZ9881193.1 sugar ABC transporter permease [Arthrobacter sp. B2a2-09]